jgi:holo-[acyl-carrier protein] synthase
VIVGLGLDLVSISAFAELLADPHSHFTGVTFTPRELAYAERTVGRRQEHLAARFAAKEAALKALDQASGLAAVSPPRVPLTDIEVTRDERGRPALLLEGAAARLAEAVGADRALVTLSHDGDIAAAVVVLERVL